MKARVLSACALSASMAVAACGVPQAQYDAALADASKEKGRSAELEKQLADAKAEAERAKASSPPEAAKPTEGVDEKTKAELDELRKQKAAADARLKTFDELVARFKKMIDAGKLEINVRRGQIVLALETDVLFDAGKTEIKKEGEAALKEIADAIKTVSGRRFQVAGHTDTAPIKTKEYPSNWELSTARAVVVVKLLVKQGVKSANLSAAGFAEYDPVGNNTSPGGRAKNRRIEIILVPNIEEIVGITELDAKHGAGKKK
ncbi:MAG: OmpA family protein [Polyangiaceae bacterium]|nr:OmpA family protein [Polyangiaceae bacterium]